MPSVSRSDAVTVTRPQGGEPGRSPWRDCAGGATVTACLALTALLLVTVMFVLFAAVGAARHRAQSAADLAALAAADAVNAGTATACDQAEFVTRRMRVHPRSCVVRGWDVTVTVDAAVSIALLGRRSVVAVARAGPVLAGKRS